MGIVWDMSNLPGETATGVEVDHAEDLLVVHHLQQVDDVLERNKRFMNSGLDGYTPSRDMRHVASIPNIILEKWLKEEQIEYWNPDHTAKLLAKLDDPEWRYLRTSQGTLSHRPVRTFVRGSTA